MINTTGFSTMFVCICNGITDRQIRSALNEGSSSFREIRAQLGVASQCGSCEAEARAIIADYMQACDDSLFYAAAPAV